jgi:hypothetical protein
MSAFAFSYAHQRIVVAADSLAYIPDRVEVKPLGFISKVLPLPHLKAVLFTRGQYTIAACAMAQLLLAPGIMTIEGAAAALPDILQDETEVNASLNGIGDPESLFMLEAVLCGWSEAKRRMRVWQFFNYEGFKPHTEGDGHYQLHAWPPLPATHAPKLAPGMDTDARLVATMQALRSYFEDVSDANCGARVGGEILSTEITPHGMCQRVLHRFSDYEQTRHAAAAVLSRVERGDLDISRAVADGLAPMKEIAPDKQELAA